MSETREKNTDSAALERLADVALPKGLTLVREPAEHGGYREASDDRGALVLTRRWLLRPDFGGGMWAVVWAAFSVLLVAPGIRDGGLFSGAGLVLLLFLSFSAYLLHQSLSWSLNSTVITVRAGRLTVRHGPVPVRGNCEIAASELKQVYVVEVPLSEGPPEYEVRAQLASRAVMTLAKSLDRREQALYIEQAIERHLHIADSPVDGELRK